MEDCPKVPVKINSDREIVKTDDLKFPWKKDENGYFLVKIQNKKIHCGFVNNNHEMIFEFVGENPDKIIKEIAKRKICDMEHLGYIASELTIANNCIKEGKKYMQR